MVTGFGYCGKAIVERLLGNVKNFKGNVNTLKTIEDIFKLFWGRKNTGYFVENDGTTRNPK